MSIGGYKIRDQSLPHFVVSAVVKWVDVFTRKSYCDIVMGSLHYLQLEKGLVLHACLRLMKYLPNKFPSRTILRRS